MLPPEHGRAVLGPFCPQPGQGQALWVVAWGFSGFRGLWPLQAPSPAPPSGAIPLPTPQS
jgi:hypothetical protein